MNVEWVLGSLILILTSLIGALFKMSLFNRGRLTNHDILLASYAEGIKRIDEIGESVDRRFDKHEERENRVLDEITRKLEKLTINVALISKSPNRDKLNG